MDELPPGVFMATFANGHRIRSEDRLTILLSVDELMKRLDKLV